MARDKSIPERFPIQSGGEAGAAPKVGIPKGILATVILAVVVVVLSLCWMPPSPPASPSVPEEADDQSSRPAADERLDVGSAPTIELPMIRGGESPAPPPIVFRPGGPSDGPDLTRPAAAVFSVLDLIDRGASATVPVLGRGGCA